MLKQKLILSYSSRIIFQVLQVVASLVVARVAGPTVLGTVAFGTAYVSLWTFVSDLGTSTAHIKLMSEGKDADACVTTFSVLRLFTTLFFIVAVFGFYGVQKYIFDYTYESPTHEKVIFISLAAVTVSQLLYIPKTTFAARTEQAKVEMPNLLQGLLLHPSRIIIVLLGFGAIALAFASLVSFLLTIPLYVYLFKGYRIRWSAFDKKLAREYIAISLPVILIGASSSVFQQIDKVLLQFFANSEAVGYYTAGFKVGGFILLIGKSVRNLFFPLFSKAVAENNQGYIKDKIDKFERFSFLFIMPAIMLVIFFSEPFILLLLGDDYTPSVLVMQLVTAAMFINVVNMPFESVVEGTGNFRISAILKVTNLLLFVGLIFIFLSPVFLEMAAGGVAAAMLISTVALAGMYRYYASKFCPILKHHKAIRFMVFGILFFTVFYLAYEWLFAENWWLQGLFVLIFTVSIFTLFTAFRWMGKKDWQNLTSLIDLKSMKNYIVDEIRGK
ncbi:MAG: oligosaccharide flippase family protein [Cyclobacteriaceae bacterium]